MQYIQIFVYNTNYLHANNNYPMLLFHTEQELIEFLDGLQYETNRETLKDKSYFVINNPHLLPQKTIKAHNKLNIGYPINTNIKLLQNSKINNNCQNTGFFEYIQTIV